RILVTAAKGEPLLCHRYHTAIGADVEERRAISRDRRAGIFWVGCRRHRGPRSSARLFGALWLARLHTNGFRKATKIDGKLSVPFVTD
ncbi:hypothetical protein, partial [Mesorhizobium humile]|uniref:hypothetical protein n=1 Tax=Mesorhizobium humile TaxID=3072313 RepID=UPI002A23A6E8